MFPTLWFGKNFWWFLPSSLNYSQNSNVQQAGNINKGSGLDIRKNNHISTVINGNWQQSQWGNWAGWCGDWGYGVRVVEIWWTHFIVAKQKHGVNVVRYSALQKKVFWILCDSFQFLNMEKCGFFRPEMFKKYNYVNRYWKPQGKHIYDPNIFYL